METIKEGHLDYLVGPLAGFQRRFFVVDSVNGFFAFAPTKAGLFQSGSETIPGCAVAEVISNAVTDEPTRGFTVVLNNQRKLQLRVERSDAPEQWIEALRTLIPSNRPGFSPETASGATGNVKITWKTVTPAEKSATKPTYEFTKESANITGVAESEETSKDFELLIVACDPTFLRQTMKMSPVEQEIFNSLKSFTFRTQIVEVNPKGIPTENVKGRVVPSVMAKMVGDLHAFRNESIKEYGSKIPSKLDGNLLITCYQILGAGVQMSNEELERRLVENFKTFSWFPYREYTLHESLYTKYFPHFSNQDLVRGLPWKLIDIQGDHRTLFVSSSSCFESVLNVWQYQAMIMESRKVQNALPRNKAAPVGIVGAGPAGLLMAVRLTRMGYTNIQIFEASDRFGGKSVSVTKDTEMGRIVCELGTCYLSADYDEFRKDFREYLDEETAVPSTVDRQFVADETLKAKQGLKQVEDFAAYAVAIGMEEDKIPGFKNVTRADMLFDMVQYQQLHDRIFHGETPFPRVPPPELQGALGKQTFAEFLRINGLQSLMGILEYVYQAQGYGSLATIPAFYGLVWITPPLVHAMLVDSIGMTVLPGTYSSNTVTYIKNGWSSVWENVMKKHKFRVTFNAKITKIDRPFGI